MADNEIRLNVTAVEIEPLNVCVEQVPMNPVNVENTYKGLDYNLLKNKPSIDGVTLEGDKTTAEVIGFDKEYVDEAILTTNAKIDNEVIVIEADIDANADAIQKTRSDFMESDSELQQQINAHANELTTQKNDIDELGDQVAAIESKIPEETSGTNPLVNKQQLLDEEMDIRKDLNQGLSELQTQITAQASAIANKVDATGDTMTGALNLPELNVSTSEGTLNLSITAGVATIATNNGLDIVSQTKFDTAPTTDDSTTWADALDTSLVRKAQVATAIAEAGENIDYVVDSYSDEEGNWYRIYKSGWIEQGGHQTPVVGAQFAEQTVMLLKPMKTTTYHKNLIASFSAKGDNTIVVRLDDLNLYTDRIIVRKHWLSENGSFYWEVKGQGA